MNLAQRLLEIEVQLQAALDDAGSQVAGGPDNPAITVLSERPRAFTISSANLGNDWTPFAHDWKSQCALLVDLVQRRAFGALGALMAGESFTDAKAGRVRLAPAVIARAAPILGDLGSLQNNMEAPRRSLRM